jgi:glutamate/tyrosine decarboxylase-like PLP-dependent enzyme
VERNLDLAQHVAGVVDAATDLERLAEVPLNIVCFRYRRAGMQDGPELDDLNRRIGEAALADGRVFFGATSYEGRTAFRPAFVNWRTREADADLVPQVVLELGASLH